MQEERTHVDASFLVRHNHQQSFTHTLWGCYNISSANLGRCRGHSCASYNCLFTLNLKNKNFGCVLTIRVACARTLHEIALTQWMILFPQHLDDISDFYNHKVLSLLIPSLLPQQQQQRGEICSSLILLNARAKVQ